MAELYHIWSGEGHYLVLCESIYRKQQHFQQQTCTDEKDRLRKRALTGTYG